MSDQPPGKLIIVSGPSGVGKSSVVSSLLDRCELPLKTSVSVTTRPSRPGEQNGVDYHFVSDGEFARRQADDEFLETVEVFEQGFWYGTLLQSVTHSLENGLWIILEIDVTGAFAVLKRFPDAITVFVHPGSREELEVRLRGRKTESEENIQQRLSFALSEMEVACSYKHVVVNSEVEKTADEICTLLKNYKEHQCTTN